MKLFDWLRSLPTTGLPLPWLRSPRLGRADPMLSVLVGFCGAALLLLVLGGSSYVGHGLTLKLPELDTAGVAVIVGLLASYLAKDAIPRRGPDAPPPEAP